MKKFDSEGLQSAILFLVAVLGVLFMGFLTYHLYGGGFCA